MRYLLDTCVISELVSATPNPKVIQWVDSIDEERLFLSVITIGEIKKGVEKLPTSKRKSALKEWLEDELLVRFNGRLLPIDTRVVLVWGELIASLEKQGCPMPCAGRKWTSVLFLCPTALFFDRIITFNH